MSGLGLLWGLLRQAPGWLLGALGALAAIVLAYLRGRAAGGASERARATEAALERRQEADRIEREVEGLSERALDERGGPWVRR